jgi:hypothetical protein
MIPQCLSIYLLLRSRHHQRQQLTDIMAVTATAAPKPIGYQGWVPGTACVCMCVCVCARDTPAHPSWLPPLPVPPVCPRPSLSISSMSTRGLLLPVLFRHWTILPGMAPTYVRLDHTATATASTGASIKLSWQGVCRPRHSCTHALPACCKAERCCCSPAHDALQHTTVKAATAGQPLTKRHLPRAPCRLPHLCPLISATS